MKCRNLSRLVCPAYDPGVSVIHESVLPACASVSKGYLIVFFLSFTASIFFFFFNDLQVYCLLRASFFSQSLMSSIVLGLCRTLIVPLHSLAISWACMVWSRKVILMPCLLLRNQNCSNRNCFYLFIYYY